MELLKLKLTSQKCQGFLFSTTPAFYESILYLFHWGILSLSPEDDSACDFVVNLMGIFCFFQRVLSFAFSLEDKFPCDFVDNLMCQKICGMLVRPLNQGITISWCALSSSLMWTFF